MALTKVYLLALSALVLVCFCGNLVFGLKNKGKC